MWICSRIAALFSYHQKMYENVSHVHFRGQKKGKHRAMETKKKESRSRLGNWSFVIIFFLVVNILENWPMGNQHNGYLFYYFNWVTIFLGSKNFLTTRSKIAFLSFIYFRKLLSLMWYFLNCRSLPDFFWNSILFLLHFYCILSFICCFSLLKIIFIPSFISISSSFSRPLTSSSSHSQCCFESNSCKYS